MSRYSAGMTAAGVGTALQPIFGVLATASVGPQIREIGLFNTTATSCKYEIVQITGGTPGATVTAFYHRIGGPTTNLCLAKQLWTADGTVVKTGYRIVLGAAIGSGGIFTFGDDGLGPVLGATSGIGIVPIGTGQICEVYMAWDE